MLYKLSKLVQNKKCLKNASEPINLHTTAEVGNPWHACQLWDARCFSMARREIYALLIFDILKFGNIVFCDKYSDQVASQTWGNRNQ